MELSISHQLFVFFCMLLCGMATGVVFDIFRAFRRCIAYRSSVIAAQDLLLWLAELVIVYCTAFEVNNAKIRGYEAIALVLGALIYFMSISEMSVKLFCRIISAAIKATEKAAAPFKKLFTAVKKPIKKLTSKIKNTASEAKEKALSAAKTSKMRLKRVLSEKKKKN